MNGVFFSLLAMNDDGYVIKGAINDGSSTFSFTINETVYEVEVVNGKWSWEIPQDFDAASLQEAFKDKTNLTSINLSKLPTSSCTNASGLFSGCTSLTKVILPKNFGGDVTDMSNMFYNCSSLGTINTAQIDISSCVDISGMFYGCTSITYLNLIPWNTTFIANYSDFVPDSSSLTIDYYSNRFNPSLVSSFPNVNWNDEYNVIRGHITNGDSTFTFTINNASTQVEVDEHGAWVYRVPSTITTLTNAFRDKTNLDVLDLTNMDTSSCTSFNSMFQESSIDKISLPQGFGSSCENMSNMFLEFTSSKLDLTNMDTSSCTNMYQMFYGCNIGEITFPENFGSACTNMNDIFNSSLMTKIDLSNFSTTTSATMNQMFRHCEDLVEVTFPQSFASNVTSMYGMFSYCMSLQSIDLSNIDVSNVTSLGSMFYYCNSLRYINLSSWNTQNVTIYEDFVTNSSSITIDYDPTIWKMAIKNAYNKVNWNDVHHYNITGKVNDSSSTFSFYIGSQQIQTPIYNGVFKYDIPSNITIGGYDVMIFNNISNLSEIEFYNIDTSLVTSFGGMFQNCTSLVEVDLSTLSTTSMTKCLNMFSGCTSLKNVIFPEHFASNADDIDGMFGNCTSLESLDLSNFDISNVTNIASMFQNCSNLKYLNLSTWNTQSVTYYVEFVPNVSTLTILCDTSIFSLDIRNRFDLVNWSGVNLNPRIIGSTNVSSTSFMFKLNGVDTRIDVDENGDFVFNIDKSINTTSIEFYSNNYITDLNFYDLNKLTSINCKNITSLTHTGMYGVFESLTTLYQAFYNCTNLASIDISKTNIPYVNNFRETFNMCDGFTSLDLTPLEIVADSDTNIQSMFLNSSNLIYLNLSNWNLTNAVNMKIRHFLPSDHSLTVDYDSTKWKSTIIDDYPNINWNDVSQS